MEKGNKRFNFLKIYFLKTSPNILYNVASQSFLWIFLFLVEYLTDSKKMTCSAYSVSTAS